MAQLALQRDCGPWWPPEAGQGPQPDSDGPRVQGRRAVLAPWLRPHIWGRLAPGTVCGHLSEA